MAALALEVKVTVTTEPQDFMG